MGAIMDWLNGLLDGSLIAGGIFLIIGVVGGILLLLSLVLDGIFDAFDFGDGPLSLTTIAAFTAIFGFTAFALVGAGLPTPFAGLLGAVAGVLGGAAAWWLSKVIRSAESSTAVSGDELVGSVAGVVLAIPAGGLGEVALVRHGERVSLSATSDTAIARGTQVRIAQTITATSVRVEPITASADSAPVDPAASPS